MKLIDKDAVLAEIEKRKKRNILSEGRYEEDIELYSLINSLEVKAFDLEEEIERVRKTHFINDDFEKATLEGRQITNIAKHFFELGMTVSNKVQKDK